MSKVVFIDEQYFDVDSPEDFPQYDGISYLPVYDIPGYDEDEVDEYSSDRDENEIVGEATVGFGGDWAEVIGVDNHKIDPDRIELAYPTL